MAAPNAASKADESLGLPKGFKIFTPYPFDGMNTSASQLAMPDKDFIWRENFIRLDEGNLRTAWDSGSAIYTAPSGATIVYYAFYSIGFGQYCAIFLSDGSAVQLNMISLAQIAIGPAGTFYNSINTQKPYCRQWGTQYLLISNRNTVNDYWIWDGALLYGAGTAAPNGVVMQSNGLNYSSIPSYTVFGGSGSGMVLAPRVSNGGVLGCTIVNPGKNYLVGDTVQVAFSGGGANTSPVLTSYLQTGTVGGAIISTPGQNYTAATALILGGGGTGATASVTISSGVNAITVSPGGSGYTYANVAITGGGGLGAAAVANIVNGAVGSITVTSSGTGYTSPPLVAVVGDGTGAAATASINTGVISDIVITNPGSGYTTTPTIQISGNGAGATASVLLAPTGVAGASVLNGGSGFTSVPLITFVGGNGAGATGTALLAPTTVASINLTASGSGYTSAPTVNFVGGNGTGAAATAVLSGDVVSNITVTNPGSGYTGPIQITLTGGAGSGAGGTVVYAPTSIASVVMSSSGAYYTQAPAVEVSTGANSSAYATITLMPYGVSGSAMETFLSRVWLINPAQGAFATIPPGGNLTFSAPSNPADFNATDGSGGSTSTDAFLQTQFTNIRQSSGYLYFFGDGSVSVASNVSTGGTPTVTTYNYQNVDPQGGLQWRDALQDFGRSTIIANATGVYGLYGGALTKISKKLDGLFATALFPPHSGAVTPSSAIAFLFNRKHYLLLMTVQDPDTLVYRNVMVTWDEKDWCVTSQSTNLQFIATQKVGSSYSAYGTDGTNIYPLFAKASTTLTKRLDTKFYGTDRMFMVKGLLGAWIQASDMSNGAIGISGTLKAVVSGLAIQNPNFPSAPNGTVSTWMSSMSFQSPDPYFALWGTAPTGSIPFVSVGMTLTTTSPDFVLGNWVIGYNDQMAAF